MSHVPFRLHDGTTGTAQPEYLDRILDIDVDMVKRRDVWIADLRAAGIKAAHPDDGWVNRDLNRIYLAYPSFDDGLQVGDLLALGSPYDRARETRIVRITRTEVPGGITLDMRYWWFEPIEGST